jgi:N-acetylglucosamine-6-phosphate deacetylase
MRAAIKGNILTPSGWVHGEISFGSRIAVRGSAVDPADNGDDYHPRLHRPARARRRRARR